MTFGMQLALFVGVGVIAHTVETVTGFGASLLALALGVHLAPLSALIPAVALLAWLQSVYTVGTHRSHIDRVALVGVILPFAGVGLAVGIGARGELSPAGLRMVLGVVPIVVALASLGSLLRRGRRLLLPPWAGRSFLFFGGICHGLFAAGGPLIVAHVSTALPDKHRQRATLGALWLGLNTALLANLLGKGGLAILHPSVLSGLGVGALLGIGVGEVLHRRLGPNSFAHVTQLVLLSAGVLVLT